MAVTQYPDAPDYTANYPITIRNLLKVVKNVMRGRTNNVYSVTLTPNQGTTVITYAEKILGPNTLLFFTPQTANAAAEIGAGTMYVSSVNADTEQVTITHANNAQTDRTFGYILVG